MRHFFLFMLFLSLAFVNLVSAEVVPAKNAKFKSIIWSAPLDMKERFSPYFQGQVGKTWDALAFKIKIDQVAKELFSNGYFSSTVSSELLGNENNIVAKIIINTKDRTNFQFIGNKVFTHQQLRSRITDKIKNDFGKIDSAELETQINDAYEEAGFYNNTIHVYQNEGKDLSGVKVINYFFEIEEGEKLKVSNVFYRGNLALTAENLEDLFRRNATPLASTGFYDRAFFEKFTDMIKKVYYSQGYVFAEVSKPRVLTNEDESLNIEYGISEKQQVMLTAIVMDKLDSQQQAIVKSIIVNKEGHPLNVVELENDLRKIVQHFQDEGNYYANIANLNDENLLQYDKSFTSVELHPNIVLDRKICFNDTVINGNTTTNSKVILREISLEKGELITPAKLDKIKQRLSNLGLFSSLRITPYMMYEGEQEDEKIQKTCATTNLVVQVNEKQFGQGEVAPGYRTDLGYKFSTGISYNNLGGMNRSASLKAQVNKRTNLDGFDERRRREDKDLWEYALKASFLEPYVLHDWIKTQLEFEISSSYQRKRFTSFDADIFRISPQFSKTFNANFSASVRYQFERINQFDATAAINNDNFSIGGITPSITWDFRNDPINPRRGTYFTLSSEWANRYFGSMKNDDLEVNYVKVISRNKLYIPMGDFTLAFSLAMGYEKNFAEDVLVDPETGRPRLNLNNVARTHGYIPSIKVFRLDGIDEIRGYDEGEINRIRSGQSIGDIVVQNEAYFTAFKFEPRYSLTDDIQLGVFYDAGRVFVNDFQPFDLRSSVGAGVKFLTPVGSLDFDYGVKLQRETYPDRRRDSVGRFHLSIGFF